MTQRIASHFFLKPCLSFVEQDDNRSLLVVWDELGGSCSDMASSLSATVIEPIELSPHLIRYMPMQVATIAGP